MKRALLIVALALCLRGEAQQTSQYTQYVLNMFSINPAVAGSKDCIDVRLGFRQQWVGYPGAPTTGWASIHGSIRQKGKPYRANRHGIGAVVEADNTGPLGYTTFALAYAYHIQMAKDYYMSFGLFGGVKQEKLDVGQINVVNNNDPLLTSKGSVLVYPEVTPGLWIYNKSSWMGLTLEQVLNNKMKDLGEDSRSSRHFMLTLGRRYRVSKTFSVVPSTLLKFSPASPVALDLNVMMEYRKQVGLGISYRNQDAVAFMVKVPFLKFFTLGYSYDVTTSRLRVASANTHEIILAIYPCAAMDPAKAIVRCPIFE